MKNYKTEKWYFEHLPKTIIKDGKYFDMFLTFSDIAYMSFVDDKSIDILCMAYKKDDIPEEYSIVDMMDRMYNYVIDHYGDENEYSVIW